MKHSPGFLKLVAGVKKRVKEVSIAHVKEKRRRKDEFALVDVREEREWKNGHVPGAMFLSKGVIERDIEAALPEKKTEIVLYCGGGFRSALAADNLRKMGYKNVFSMAGGWRAWKKSRGRIVRA